MNEYERKFHLFLMVKWEMEIKKGNSLSYNEFVSQAWKKAQELKVIHGPIEKQSYVARAKY